jgi:hypothetical protein
MTITLPSPGGPRRSQLRSSNNRLVNSVSQALSAKKSSSSEDEDSSITRMFLEPPCSNTGEQGRREETSERDPGGGDPDGTGGGVLASLGRGLPSTEGERSRLMPLLSSIVGKQGVRERNPKQEETWKRNARWFPAGNEGDIYSLGGVTPLL